MSFKKTALFPPNPITTRGVSTKLSASKNKIVYTNGKAVIVRIHGIVSTTNSLITTLLRSMIWMLVKCSIDCRRWVTPGAEFTPSNRVFGTCPKHHGCSCLAIRVLLRIRGCHRNRWVLLTWANNQPMVLNSVIVRVWDTVGEDQTLKGEYKVISGRMCVQFLLIWISGIIIGFRVATIWNGTERVSVSLLLGMAERSQCRVWLSCRISLTHQAGLDTLSWWILGHPLEK